MAHRRPQAPPVFTILQFFIRPGASSLMPCGVSSSPRSRLKVRADHGVSEALYLRDPDDNGVELYWDRPKEKWPKKADGSLQMYTNPLDLHDLLGELDRTPA